MNFVILLSATFLVASGGIIRGETPTNPPVPRRNPQRITARVEITNTTQFSNGKKYIVQSMRMRSSVDDVCNEMKSHKVFDSETQVEVDSSCFRRACGAEWESCSLGTTFPTTPATEFFTTEPAATTTASFAETTTVGQEESTVFADITTVGQEDTTVFAETTTVGEGESTTTINGSLA